MKAKKPTKGNSKTKIFLNLSSDKFGDELNNGYNQN